VLHARQGDKEGKVGREGGRKEGKVGNKEGRK